MSIKNLDPSRGWFYRSYESDYPLSFLDNGLQGGVTYILTVGRSVTGVKLKVNGQGLQKLSSHRSNKKLHGQETKRKL